MKYTLNEINECTKLKLAHMPNKEYGFVYNIELSLGKLYYHPKVGTAVK